MLNCVVQSRRPALTSINLSITVLSVPCGASCKTRLMSALLINILSTDQPIQTARLKQLAIATEIRDTRYEIRDTSTRYEIRVRVQIHKRGATTWIWRAMKPSVGATSSKECLFMTKSRCPAISGLMPSGDKPTTNKGSMTLAMATSSEATSEDDEQKH